MSFTFKGFIVWWEVSGKADWVKKGAKAQKDNLILLMRLEADSRGREFPGQRKTFKVELGYAKVGRCERG